MTNVVHQWNTLYSLSSKGKVKQWGIQVVEEDGRYYWISSHGYQGLKIVEERSSAIQGKNIGKKNETTPMIQAISDAASKWQGKIDKNYTETIPTSINEFVKILPMLAHKWVEKKHKIVYPCYVQPKLNGVRCLATEDSRDEYTFTSRGGKEYTTLRHIEEALVELTGVTPGIPFDGEIFTQALPFEDITSAVKKLKPNTELLEYWIYDIADPTKTFEERLEILLELEEEIPEGDVIRIVPTYEVHNEEELMEYHRKFSLEYEGTMVRNKNGKYVYDYRSTDLQKLKDFLDEEFLIIGGKEGSGSDEGTVVFRCATKDGKEFDVRPRGTREQRREWYDDLENIVGKMLTVRFQNYSEDGIPIFPIGVIIRDYE